MNKLIGICGEKGAGKDISAKMLQYILACSNNRSEATFIEYKRRHIDNNIPIKDINYPDIYQFAYPLKDIISIMFGIPREDLDDRDKKDKLWINCKNLVYKEYYELNSLDVCIEDFNLKDVSRPIFKRYYEYIMNSDNVYIRIRTLLQHIGTDIFHNIFGQNVWINATLRKCTSYSIISDVRFINEAHAIFDNGGIIIKIVNTKDHHNHIDNHASEIQIGEIKEDYLIIWNGEDKEKLFCELVNIIKSIEV